MYDGDSLDIPKKYIAPLTDSFSDIELMHFCYRWKSNSYKMDKDGWAKKRGSQDVLLKIKPSLEQEMIIRYFKDSLRAGLCFVRNEHM